MGSQVYALPKYFALKCKPTGKYEMRKNYEGKYLKIITDKPGAIGQHDLYFTEQTVMSPFAKFEREESESHTHEEIVHLRCCYNNRYWVVGAHGLAGEAQVPEEDVKKPSCTLFKAEFVDGDDKHKSVRLRHVHSNRYLRIYFVNVGLLDTKPDTDEKPDGDSDMYEDVFEVVDLTELVELPKRVVLKGDNGKYLKPERDFIYPPSSGLPVWRNDLAYYLKFSGGSKWDDDAVHEVFTNPDGTIRIKSEGTGKFWGAWGAYLERVWIRSDRADNYSQDKVFSILKIRDPNVIALKNMATGQFCKRLDADGKWSYLAPATDRTTDECIELMVEEPVVSRTIYGLVYHEHEIRIHSRHEDRNPTILRIHENPQQTPSPNEYSYEESKTETSTWTRTDSWTKTSRLDVGLEVGLEFKVAEVPVSAKGSIHYEQVTEENRTVVWGETKTHSSNIKLSGSFTVPPMSKTTVYMKKITEVQEIPFSYTQKDKYPKDRVENIKKDDGMYTRTVVVHKTWTEDEPLKKEGV